MDRQTQMGQNGLSVDEELDSHLRPLKLFDALFDGIVVRIPIILWLFIIVL